MKIKREWKLLPHSYQIADTGDYDGHYEITDGNISIYTTDEDEESLEKIVQWLNEFDGNFYDGIDDLKYEIELLKEENKRLHFMVENGLGWDDMKNDISPMHEI